VNHATLTNIFYVTIQFGYIFGNQPAFASPSLNAFLCSFSELFWPFSIYIRSYSIFLIALYRYVAVFRLNLFSKINSSYWYLLAPVVVIWTLSIAFPILFKYSFQTEPSEIFCFDGHLVIYEWTIIYYVLNELLNVVVPSVSIVAIYILILRKLRSLQHNLYSESVQNSENNLQSTPQSHGKKEARKDRRFANQFLLMCLSIILSASFLSIIQLRHVIETYTTLFYYWRPVFRAFIELSMSIVPVIAIYYHPSRRRFLSRIRSILNRRR
jgi:hypothetical protein